MKRSGDVTAAAVVLFLGSGFLLLMTAFVPLALMNAPRTGVALPHGIFIGFAAIYFLLAAWGIITGIGVLKRRPWARISMIVISAAGIFFSLFGFIGAFAVFLSMTPDPTMPSAAIAVMVVVEVLVAAIPLGISIWWLVLFTRKRVALEFAAHGTGAASFVPAAHPQSAGFIPPPARTGFAATHPTSITVIAVLLLAIAALFPLVFLYPPGWRIAVVFGILITGHKMMLASTVWAILGLTLGAGLFRLKNWARIGTILYCLLSLVNTIMSMGKTGALVNAMHEAMGIPAPPLPPAFQRAIAIGGVAFGVALNFAAIYFLVTRRAAFYPKVTGVPPSSSFAPTAPPEEKGTPL